MWLNSFSNTDYDPGRSLAWRSLWLLIGSKLLATSLIPFYPFKRSVLRAFGARVGKYVVIKPGVRVKYPWKLEIGDHSWIGEDVWIDNLATVSIADNVCISQGSYLCTGNHNWNSPHFDLRTEPIKLKSHVWIGAKTMIGPGVIAEEGAVTTIGSVVRKNLQAWSINSGNPCSEIKKRSQQGKPNKSILFVNQSFYPDTTASAQFIHDAASHLCKNDFPVQVLASSQNYITLEPLSKFEVIDNISIYRSGRRLFESKNKLLRALNALWIAGCLTARALVLPKVDVIITCTSPPLISIPLRFVAWLKGAEHIAWVFDLNPDQAAAAGWINKTSLSYKICEKLLVSTLAASDAVITLDKYMSKKIEDKGVSPKSIHEVSLWINSDTDTPIKRENNTFRSQNFCPKDFVVLYAGNLSLCHPIKPLLDAAIILRDEKDIVFAFVGGGPRMAEIEDAIVRHSLTNIRVIPYQPRSALDQVLESADLHVISMGESYVGIVHPSKTYGVLGSGKPFVFLGPKNSFIYEQFMAKGLGQHCDFGDTNKLIDIINRTKSRTVGEEVLHNDSFHDAIKTFSREKVLTRLQEVIAKV